VQFHLSALNKTLWIDNKETRPMSLNKTEKLYQKALCESLTACAAIDAQGWRKRNPEADVPSAQVVQNHYSMSRTQGKLGTVPRATQGSAFEAYKATFLQTAAANKKG